MALAANLAAASAAGGITWVGIVIPGVTFLISFVLTWWLYRHFSSK